MVGIVPIWEKPDVKLVMSIFTGATIVAINPATVKKEETHAEPR